MVLALLLAGCHLGGSGSPTSGTTSSNTHGATSTSTSIPHRTASSGTTSSLSTAPPSSRAIVGKARPTGARWHLVVPPGRTLAESSSWPDARTVFAKSELRAIFPEVRTITVNQCKKSSEFYGSATAKDATCTYTLGGAGRPAYQRPSLEVELETFGTDSQMSLQWNLIKGPDRKSAKQHPGQYHFWKPGSFGAKDAYENYGALNVLVSNGTVAGIVYINPNNLMLKADPKANASAITSQIFPLLIRTLAAKLP